MQNSDKIINCKWEIEWKLLGTLLAGGGGTQRYNIRILCAMGFRKQEITPIPTIKLSSREDKAMKISQRTLICMVID